MSPGCKSLRNMKFVIGGAEGDSAHRQSGHEVVSTVRSGIANVRHAE
jgi:hypothetical protein